jgi:hypothetical protein
MAAGTKKSDNVTNMESTPISALSKKVRREMVLIDEVEVATTNIDDIGDIILFGPVPSNAVITSIKIFSDDLDSNGSPALAYDVGLYYSGNGNGNKASGVVVDADCFATAVAASQAATTDVTNVGKVGYECRFEVADIDTIDKEAWEVAGLTTDCGGMLYLGLTVTAAAATAVAGGIKVVVRYMA